MRGILIGGCCAAALSTVSAGATPVQWSGNGHHYEFLPGSLLAPVAEMAAEAASFLGMRGYLATITSAAENAFVTSLAAGETFAAIIGLSDRESPGVYRWIGGPEEGMAASFLPWSASEPNDSGSGEDYVEIFETGLWNDIGPPASFYDTARAYVVEYSATSDAGVIPLPAPAVLLLGGLGLLCGFRRLRT